MSLLIWLIFGDFCEIFRHFHDFRRFRQFRGIDLAILEDQFFTAICLTWLLVSKAKT